MGDNIFVRFDGLVAKRHHLPMGHLGESLLGTDKIANAGMIVFLEGRRPKARERSRLELMVEAPKEGCLEIKALLEHAQWALPLATKAMNLGASVILKHFLSLTLARFSKKSSEAQMHLDALTQMNRDHLTARNTSEAQWQETILRVIDRLHQPAIQMVSPVGRSATTMKVASRTADPAFIVNEEMADTIRLGNKDVVEDASPIKIVVDGVIHHSRQLKILHPEIDGKYLTANIRDPIFDSAPSPYHTAASQLKELNVLAKIVRRDGEFVGLFVLDIIR